MAQLSILSQLNFYNLLNAGYKIIAERREDDVEMEDEGIDEEHENEDNEKNDKANNNNDTDGDVHEGGERMPDIEDIFKRDEDFSFAECF